MFIRVVKKKKPNSDNTFYQFSLVQSARVDGKVKQTNILYLGSDPLLMDLDNRKTVAGLLKSLIHQTPLIFDDFPEELVSLAKNYYQKYLIRYELENEADRSNVPHSLPPKPHLADYHAVDLKTLDVSEVKSFGNEMLCKHIMETLQMPQCLAKLGFTDLMAQKSCIAIIARAIYAASEYKTSQILELNSELKNLYNIDKSISHKQLYTIADRLYKHRHSIDKHIFGRVTDLFNLNNKLVIFDISNTYFETGKRNSKIAKYGRSKEKRYDCPLVVFTGVINAEGFIRYSRIYEGNKSDESTLADMIDDLEHHADPIGEKTIVIDSGIATEENLELINKRKLKYVCVSRKRLKDYPISDTDKKVIKLTDRKKNKVSLSLFKHPQYKDQWMYVQSDQKRVKEQSMAEKLHQRFVTDLEQIEQALDKKGGTKTISKVHQRIGRAIEKHKRVSSQYKIEVSEDNGKATAIKWIKKTKEIKVKTDKEKGIYFIRTNKSMSSESSLWDIYNCIREVESTFRCLKSDLKIRPIEHQNDSRVKSHIYLTILAYQLVNTIRHMLKQNGIKMDWNNITRIMSTQTIQTVYLPTETKDIELRLPSNPIREVNEIYKATGCKPNNERKRKYVVYH
jgi:transposase